MSTMQEPNRFDGKSAQGHVLGSIIEDWTRRGIPIEKPGFYNHPDFVRAEQEVPDYINRYAQYVRERSYSDAYLSRSAGIVRAAASILLEAVFADGRSNLCVGVSKVLAGMLDRLGVWNYVVAGGLAVTFHADGRQRTERFYPFDVRPVDAAHAWVVVPPYRVVDLTLRQQRYQGGAQEYLPQRILANRARTVEVTAQDVCSPVLLQGLRLKFRDFPDDMILAHALPQFVAFSRMFPPELVGTDWATLKYIPTRVITPEHTLEHLPLTLAGRTPEQLFKQLQEHVSGGVQAGAG